MSKKQQIKDLATIHSGYSFRTKIQNNPEGKTFVIQMRDISNDRTRIANTPHLIDGSAIKDKHLLQKGDVLFVAKGGNNFAICYDENYKPAVAASVFFVLRDIKDNVLPAYLCLFINSSLGQNYLKSNMAGTYIPNVNRSTLEEMEIIIPPLKSQELMVNLYRLSKKEAEILEELKGKKQILLNSILTNLITKNHGN